MLRLICTGVSMLARTIQASAQAVRNTMQVGGLQRTYYVYAPSNSLPPQGMMIFLHGYGGSTYQDANNMWGLEDFAERTNVLGVFPLGRWSMTHQAQQ